MTDRNIETIIAAAVKIGTVETLRVLGLLSEKVSMAEAYRLYSKKMVSDWRDRGWIIGYPTGNSQRGKVYFKRSELERASAMLDIRNSVPDNNIFTRGLPL